MNDTGSPRAGPMATDGPGLVAAANALATTYAREAARRDAERRLATAEFDALRPTGILAARVPKSHGGVGASVVDLTRVLVALGRGDPNIAQSVIPHFSLIEKLLITDDVERQRRYFPIAVRGVLITNAIAERGGKFPGDILTKLIPHGDGFVLRGTKYYCTGSLFADYLYVTAADPSGKNVQAIIPCDREGLKVVDDWDGMGQRTTASGTVTLNDVRVDKHELIASSREEGRTYYGAFTQLCHAAMDAGIAFAALDDAIMLARTKARPVPEAKVDRAADDPYAMHAVGEMGALARAGAAICEYAAGVVDTAAAAYLGGKADEKMLVEASIAVAEAKVIAAEVSLRTSEMLYRVGGAVGASRSLNLDRHWRNARTHTLHDPVSYKYKAVGDYYLNGTYPPNNAKY